MGGGRDKKKKAKDPLKKAALAAKKADKADKVVLRRLQKEGEATASEKVDNDHDSDHRDRGATNNDGDDGDWDAILESYRRRTGELTTAELVVIDDPFPRPPRGNFTWTLCPSNGMFYMVSRLLVGFCAVCTNANMNRRFCELIVDSSPLSHTSQRDGHVRFARVVRG